MNILQKMEDEYLRDLKSLADTVFRLKSKIALVEKLERLLPVLNLGEWDNVAYFEYSKQLRITIPWNMDRADDILKSFQGYGWREEKEPEKDIQSISFYWSFVDIDDNVHRLQLVMQARTWEVPGQSCKLVQVGTKTIEQPVYEVHCKEPE